MQVRFVGCGDAFGSGGRYNTCFHVTGSRVNFLIDCGASSLPALKRLDIVRDDIDLVLITHFHGDHIGAMQALARMIASGGIRARVPILEEQKKSYNIKEVYFNATLPEKAAERLRQIDHGK